MATTDGACLCWRSKELALLIAPVKYFRWSCRIAVKRFNGEVLGRRFDGMNTIPISRPIVTNAFCIARKRVGELRDFVSSRMEGTE